MIEIADKDDIARLDKEIMDLKYEVQEMKNEIKALKETRESFKNLISSLGGGGYA